MLNALTSSLHRFHLGSGWTLLNFRACSTERAHPHSFGWIPSGSDSPSFPLLSFRIRLKPPPFWSHGRNFFSQVWWVRLKGEIVTLMGHHSTLFRPDSHSGRTPVTSPLLTSPPLIPSGSGSPLFTPLDLADPAHLTPTHPGWISHTHPTSPLALAHFDSPL